jgi:hypothetical protein
MVQGRPHTLTQSELLTVATWATMTAIVVEARDYEDVNVPESQRRLVMREERPPASVVIYAACAEI